MPMLWTVHVHGPLRGPDPIIFPAMRAADVFAFPDVKTPLDAREVDAPLIAVKWRPCRFIVECPRDLPWDGDLDSPALVEITRVVDGAVDVDRGFQAGDVPGILWFAAVAGGLFQAQVPCGVEVVHLKCGF